MLRVWLCDDCNDVLGMASVLWSVPFIDDWRAPYDAALKQGMDEGGCWIMFREVTTRSCMYKEGWNRLLGGLTCLVSCFLKSHQL